MTAPLELEPDEYYEIYYLHPVHTDWWRQYDEILYELDSAIHLANQVSQQMATPTKVVKVEVTRTIVD